MKNSLDVFESVSIPKAIAANAIPAILGMIVTLLYNMADTFFIGQTGDGMQVAAVALTTPVFFLFMATGGLFGIGGTSVISRAFGQKRDAYARQVSSFCFWGSVLSGIVYMAAFWIFMPLILKLIGTSPETIGFARDYLFYVAPAAPFVIIGNAFSNIVRAEGKSRQAMMGMMIGTIVNIVLDPILILWLDMGVTGAAIATVIGNVVGASYYVIFFLRKKFQLSISIKDFKMGDGILTSVFAIGIPASLNHILMSFSFIIFNNVLAVYGDIQVAAMGITMRVGMIIVMLQIGLGMGIQPLLGYNYGARNKERYKETIKISVIISIVIGIVLTAVCWFGAGAIVGAFIDSPDIQRYGVVFLKALIIPGPLLGIMFIYTNALQAMGAARASLVLSVSRQGLIFLPLLFILNAVAGLTGIVYTQAAADLLSIVLAVVLHFVAFNKLWGPDNRPLEVSSSIAG